MFGDLVPGEYVLTAHRHTALTRLVLVPSTVPVLLAHRDLTLKDTFKVSPSATSQSKSRLRSAPQ